MDLRHTYDRLRLLLDEKLGALKQYQSITDEMENVRTKPDLQQLRSLLFDRHKYMRKIETVDKSILAVVQSHRKQFETISNKYNRLFDRYRQDYLNVLEAVSPLDEKIIFFLEMETEKTKTELLAINRNKQAVSSYGSRSRSVSRYLDTKK